MIKREIFVIVGECECFPFFMYPRNNIKADVEPEQAVNDTAGGDRTVTFRVEGAGEMKVTGNGVTKEDVVSLLMSNMKDVLMGIIQQEIEEEGDLSYEF